MDNNVSTGTSVVPMIRRDLMVTTLNLERTPWKASRGVRGRSTPRRSSQLNSTPRRDAGHWASCGAVQHVGPIQGDVMTRGIRQNSQPFCLERGISCPFSFGCFISIVVGVRP